MNLNIKQKVFALYDSGLLGRTDCANMAQIMIRDIFYKNNHAFFYTHFLGKFNTVSRYMRLYKQTHPTNPSIIKSIYTSIKIALKLI